MAVQTSICERLVNNPLDLTGKVALVTGAARGQGRSHAIQLAEQGADILAVDICDQIETVPYPMGSLDDLEETEKLVASTGRRIIAEQTDIRDLNALQGFVSRGVVELGRLDVVVANAGIINGVAPLWELTEQQFRVQVDVNLLGVWKTVKATVPHLLAQGQGGSVILVSSMSGLVAELNVGHYSSAKHGVIGMMRTLAVELAPHWIRVNAVCPTNVNTPMINNPSFNTLFAGGKIDATHADAVPAMKAMNALPIPYVDPIDVSNAVLHLAADTSRYVTGTTMVVDAGAMGPFKIPHV